MPPLPLKQRPGCGFVMRTRRRKPVSLRIVETELAVCTTVGAVWGWKRSPAPVQFPALPACGGGRTSVAGLPCVRVLSTSSSRWAHTIRLRRQQTQKKVEEEKEQFGVLVRSMYPGSVAERLMAGETQIVYDVPFCTVCSCRRRRGGRSGTGLSSVWE